MGEVITKSRFSVAGSDPPPIRIRQSERQDASVRANSRKHDGVDGSSLLADGRRVVVADLHSLASGRPRRKHPEVSSSVGAREAGFRSIIYIARDLSGVLMHSRASSANSGGFGRAAGIRRCPTTPSPNGSRAKARRSERFACANVPRGELTCSSRRDHLRPASA